MASESEEYAYSSDEDGYPLEDDGDDMEYEYSSENPNAAPMNFRGE
jgi:hypothetical protein